MNDTDSCKQIRKMDEEQALRDFFPGKSCGAEDCEIFCAEALKIAQKLNLEPVPFVRNLIAGKIAPKYGCSLSRYAAESLEHMRCRFGFIRPETAVVFDDTASDDAKISMIYVFDATNENCDKCKTLDGTTVTAEQMEDDKYMRKLGFWKQEDGVYRPHPHCKCVWKGKKDESQKRIDKIIKKANAELMNALVKSKEIIKKKSEDVVQSAQRAIPDVSVSAYNSLFAGLQTTASQQIVILERKIKEVEKEMNALINSHPLNDINYYTVQFPTLEYVNALNELKQITKRKHYDRLKEPDQQPQNLPKSPEEAIKRGFKRATDNQNWYHRNKGQLDNEKYYHPVTGQEIVFDKEGKIVTIPENIGTKNYGPKLNLWHFIVDVIPYYIWGNSENDTTPLWNRLWGPSK